MSANFPSGYVLEQLRRDHPRKAFSSGSTQVDDWLASKALQQQEKHLSVTRVLLNSGGAISGYYTLATGQIDFSDLPADISRGLPRRVLPIAKLAWLGIDRQEQGQGLGSRLLAQALVDCFHAGQTFAFVAVILDAIDDRSKAFYQRFDFRALPGYPYRLFLSAKHLAAMMEAPAP